MVKKLLLSFVFVVAPSAALAAPNVGGCGWGSKLMDGSEGIAPQVLAVTTNGTSGNQTFGISSGTSGCSQEGVVKSNWQTAMYIDSNMNKIAKDASQGQGESLDALAGLLGMSAAEKVAFFSATKDNFGRIFPEAGVSSEDVRASWKEVLLENDQLSGYAELI